MHSDFGEHRPHQLGLEPTTGSRCSGRFGFGEFDLLVAPGTAGVVGDDRTGSTTSLGDCPLGGGLGCLERKDLRTPLAVDSLDHRRLLACEDGKGANGPGVLVTAGEETPPRKMGRCDNLPHRYQSHVTRTVVPTNPSERVARCARRRVAS